MRLARLTVTATFVALLAAPLAAVAQTGGKVYRLGILNLTSPLFRPETDPYDRALAEGLRERGYVIGQNLTVELRAADGKIEQLPVAAAALVALKPDVILADATPKVQALMKVTHTVPIVFCATADPVGDGLIASFARPGGNATGLSTISSELSAKRLELLREIAPRATRMGVIGYRGYAQAVRALAATEEAAQPLGIQIKGVQAREDELDAAFTALVREGPGAIIILPALPYFGKLQLIAELASKHRMPTIYEYRAYPLAGGLMSYGPNLPELYRRAAGYIDRILRGANPADLPVEQPTKFELVINLKTAKALGLTIPPAVLARADEIIQ